MNKKSAGSSFLLLITACIWGLSFVSQSKGMEYMQPFTFNGIRCLIGAAVLALYILAVRIKKGRRAEAMDWKLTLRAGMWCGVLLAMASMLQQYGVKYTSVGKVGFITTLYIIFVPIAGIFFRKKVSATVWLGAAMAAVGMYLLCMTEGLRLGTGDILVFICSLFFTAHILVIDHYSPKTDGVIVSCIQFTVCGILCTAGALLFDRPVWTQVAEGAGTLLYAGVLSCGVAYTLQIVGQKHVKPAAAALILSLESVIASVAGWGAYKIGFLAEDQSLTPVQAAGCAIVFAAVVFVQIPIGARGGRKCQNNADDGAAA